MDFLGFFTDPNGEDTMQYDPVKDQAARLIKANRSARILFYRMLDLLLLRQRYVKRALRQQGAAFGQLRYYDAGAGFCQYSWYVLKRFPAARVLATDLKREYLEDFAAFASSRFPRRFAWLEADLQNFVPEEKFQLVTAIDILEHIPDDAAVLRNFHACLEEGGKLIISTPSDLDIAARFTEEHVRPGYNKLHLEELLGACGFELEESVYSYGKWGALAWRLLMKHPLALLGKSYLWAILLPLYYLIVLPVAEVLMRLDLRAHNARGTGIFIVARKTA